MANTKEIRKQISSISNTQKITSAMEMVASSKMRKTQDRMEMGRPYADRMLSVIGHLANSNPEYKPLYMSEREVKAVGIIVVGSDKGLCGGLNINLFRNLLPFLKDLSDQNIEQKFCPIGTKARVFFNNFGGEVVSTAEKLGDIPALESLIGAIKVLLDKFEQGEIDQVFLASNRFENTMTQEPNIKQLLPLLPEDTPKLKRRWDYIYEPDAKELLDGLMQRYIESLVYQAVIENIACEQAAKMVAMKNATENAGTIIDELQLIYNNARQAAITQELSEIVAGAEAL
ncbi:MAG: F0F1 ATP synthase subunit gamma [Gammaproteobacteria bacterium]|nr:F0F1 ATP synthase subunit gamma [Gammaproteobacteria bacterium]